MISNMCNECGQNKLKLHELFPWFTMIMFDFSVFCIFPKLGKKQVDDAAKHKKKKDRNRQETHMEVTNICMDVKTFCTKLLLITYNIYFTNKK